MSVKQSRLFLFYTVSHLYNCSCIIMLCVFILLLVLINVRDIQVIKAPVKRLGWGGVIQTGQELWDIWRFWCEVVFLMLSC